VIYARRSVVPDVAAVSKDIRPEDAAEIRAASGMEPFAGLMTGYLHSDECWTICTAKDHKAIALFGLRMADEGQGVVWLLATNDLPKYGIRFLRESRGWIDRFHQKADLLFNAVDQRNTVHIRWLEWLGFKFIRVIPEYGHLKLPFVEFARIKSHV